MDRITQQRQNETRSQFRKLHHFTLNAALKHSWYKRTERLRTFIRTIKYLSQNQTAAFLRGAARPPAARHRLCSGNTYFWSPSQPAAPERNIKIHIDIQDAETSSESRRRIHRLAARLDVHAETDSVLHVSVSVSNLYHQTCWTLLLASVSRINTCAHTPYTEKSFLTFLYIYEAFKKKFSHKQSFDSSVRVSGVRQVSSR